VFVVPVEGIPSSSFSGQFDITLELIYSSMAPSDQKKKYALKLKAQVL
jgi:hypothetical protein